MFDCAGYVFGSGLVVRIEKKKKGGEGGKNRATFAVLNLASGGEAGLEESLTACHLKARMRPLSSALSPSPVGLPHLGGIFALLSVTLGR